MTLTAAIIPVFDTMGVPPKKLDRWLIENRQYDGPSWRDIFWLADNLDTIAAMPEDTEEGTDSGTPTNQHWQSPFVGKFIADILNFMENIPRSHHEIVDPNHFVIMDADLKDRGLVKLYRRKDWADPDEDFTGKSCPEVWQNGVTSYAQPASLAWMDFSPLQGGDWERRVHPGVMNYVGTEDHDPNWWYREDTSIGSGGNQSET